MRTGFLLAAVAALPSALAHYNFEALIVNGQVTSPYQYVRKTSNYNSPITDVTSPDIVCNQGANSDATLAATSTYAVKAGDTIGFTINANIGHPGPLAVYLSRAPGSVKSYKGDGAWVKVHQLSYNTLNPLDWATSPNSNGITRFTFRLPTSLPNGEYLVRAEHIGLHGASSFGGAQFYIGCAQIAVTGGGNGNPSPTVRFPGAYTGRESGILVNIYWPPLTSYANPGPAVWRG